MVCDWGMSILGPIAFGQNEDTVFLGREITRSQAHSEETSRVIDAEVKKLIDEQYARAKEIIVAHRAALEKITEALLEFETIDGKHVNEILEFGEIRSPIRPPEPPPVPQPPGKPEGVIAPRPESEPPFGGAHAPSPA
jgi:cell division protease FtsH